MVNPNDTCAKAEEVNSSLRSWRQGDFVLAEQWFAYRFSVSSPITDAAREAASSNIDLVETAVKGLVVVSQTCDVVRDCLTRPYVEVAPLVAISDDDKMKQIRHARRPQYAFIPALGDQRLVADLDRIMTVEKPVVAGWARQSGCRTDTEIRLFADALARKRMRFAFPDDFTLLVESLRKRIEVKHDKCSPEGLALQSLCEIRVTATPSWSDKEAVCVHFWFIRYDQAQDKWDEHLAKWLALIPPEGRFKEVDGVVVTLDDLTAREYVDSVPLDLDHVSMSSQSHEPDADSADVRV